MKHCKKVVILEVGLWKQIGSHTNKSWNAKCCSILYFFSRHMWTQTYCLHGRTSFLVLWDWFYITTHKEWLISCCWNFILTMWLHYDIAQKFLKIWHGYSCSSPCLVEESRESSVLLGHLWGEKKMLYSWWKIVYVQQIQSNYIRWWYNGMMLVSTPNI